MIAQRRRRTPALRLEALESRQVLSTAAHPLHAAVAAHAVQAHVAPVHAAAAKPAAVPNPVLVVLTPGVAGIKITDVSFDARVHLITIKGTVDVTAQATSPYYPYYGYTPTYPTTASIGVVANQAATKFQSVSGYQYSNLTIADATVTKLPFTSKLVASAGKFGGGMVELSITASNAYYYGYNTYSVIAHMRNAKAY